MLGRHAHGLVAEAQARGVRGSGGERPAAERGETKSRGAQQHGVAPATGACQDEVRTCDSPSAGAFMVGSLEALRRLAGWNPEGTYETGAL